MGGQGGKGNIFAVNKTLFKTTVWRVWLGIVVFNMGAVMFGFDSAMFGALQVTPSWLNTFGTPNEHGKMAITADQKAVINAMPWLGKLVAVFIVEPITDRWGYRISLIFATVVEIIGVIVEMVGRSWGVFCAGRTIVYISIGYLGMIVPLYIGEIVYPQSRGFFTACYSLLVAASQIWCNGAIQGISKDTTKAGWLITCGQQLIPPVFLFLGIYWCPDSPRWLLQKGRHQKALETLATIRTTEDNQSGWVEMEILSIQETIKTEESNTHNSSWFDLFRETNLRRTFIASMAFLANQWTGNQFVGSYAPTLYVMLGLEDEAFIYTIIKSVMALVAILCTMAIVDKVGRRFVVIGGGIMEFIFMYLLAGMGTISNPSKSDLRTMVASIQLFIFFCRGSTVAMAFLIPAEVSTLRLRKKTMAFATIVDTIAAVVVTYVSPYLIEEDYADLGAKVGFVFGGFTTLYVLWAVFFLPELKGRSLEEVDELFEAKLWAWQFSRYQTQSLAGRVAHHENEQAGKQVMHEEETVAAEVEGARIPGEEPNNK